MLKDTKAFSGYSVNDLEAAKRFYGETLGLEVTENSAGLGLELAGGQRVFMYPKDDHEPATFTDASIYQVNSTWTNDLGKAVQLGSLGGKPQVITMFFAKCEYACPILAHDMKRIEAALPEPVLVQVGFTLVTFDTERDSVEELAKFRAKENFDAKWTLLRGSSADVLELAALLGIKFKKDARGQFAHSNVILVLNADGEIIHQQVGLNQPVEATANQIRQILEGAKGS